MASLSFDEMSESSLKLKIARTTNPNMTEDFVRVGSGKCFLPREFLDHCDSILDFEVRHQDIWVLSFMKTGTTWVKELVWLLVNDLDFEKAKEKTCYSRFPNFESSATVKLLKLPRSGSTSMDQLTSLPESKARLIHSHLPWTLLPRSIQSGLAKPKIIYISRNPLDVAVSYFHHRVLFEGFLGSMDDFVDLFINDAVRYAPFWNHVREFWNRQYEPNILFLTYEEMKRDLTTTALKIANFLGKSIQLDSLEKLMDHVSLENMKKNPSVNHETQIDRFITKHGVPRQSDFIRKGKVNAWKEEMSKESQDKMLKWYHDNRIQGLWTELEEESLRP